MPILERWKIVEIDSDGKLKSAVMFRNKGLVEYNEGVWTLPNEQCGPLTVFGNLGSALAFFKLMTHDISSTLKMFTCEYEQSLQEKV